MAAGSAVKVDDGCWGEQFPGPRAFHPGRAAAAAAACAEGLPAQQQLEDKASETSSSMTFPSSLY